MPLKLGIRPYIHLYMPNELILKLERIQVNIDRSFHLTTHTSLSSLVHAVRTKPTDVVILPSQESLLVGMIRERESLYAQLDKKPHPSELTDKHLEVESELFDEDGLQQDSDDECAIEQTDSLQTKTCCLSEHPEVGIMIVLYDDTIEEGHPFDLYNIEGGEIGVDVSSHSRNLQPSHIHSWLMMRLHSNSKAW